MYLLGLDHCLLRDMLPVHSLLPSRQSSQPDLRCYVPHQGLLLCSPSHTGL